ncbi:MAG TPA: oxygen-dependent coproporphyrinogen oxidase [Bacteroidetes bacterium]|nr:oxygen-dependent coproporphyrinogen oxidase [Bacteroidota bacterium]
MTERPNRLRVQTFFQDLQDSICARLEELDTKAVFVQDEWRHAEGGGGRTRVMETGKVFEKAGVNTSAISGSLSESLAHRLSVKQQRFFATGLSIVVHPYSPMVPAVHANFRYFELEDAGWWFGGGADLTPSYLFEEDAEHFHTVWKLVCDRHDSGSYERFKEWCDEYFFIKHRGERRGIGGIFFDNLTGEFESIFRFVQACGTSFLNAYAPIVDRRRHQPWGEREKNWQLLRRSRYVEFNLIYDQGTIFGLETQGRIESILMYLPPLVRWSYNVTPEPDSHEGRLLEVLKQPREWIRS